MLSGENFGRGSHLSDYQKIIDRYMKFLGIEPSSSIISDYPPFINELIATNMGVSFLPQLSWYFSREKNIPASEHQKARNLCDISISHAGFPDRKMFRFQIRTVNSSVLQCMSLQD